MLYSSRRGLRRPLLLAALLGLSLSQVQAATLNIGTQGEPASLDTARIGGSVWENDILGDIYEGLVTLDPEGQYVPGVARDWRVSDDGLSWTFHLRDDAKWSDGAPVTAQDFKLAFSRLFMPENGAVYASLFYPIRGAEPITKGEESMDALGIDTPDDHTLVFHLNQPTPYFPTLLAHIAASPVPAHVIKRYGKDWASMEHITTNGAFTPVKWVSQDHLTTVRNDNFHDADSVSLEGVNFYPIENRNSGLTRFRSGELDIVRDFPPARIDALKEQLPGAVHLAPQLANYYFALNQRPGHPTADRRVREALNLAVARDVIARHIMGGTVTASSSFVPDGVAHYDARSMPGMGPDMKARQARARRLLEEAGYGPDKPLTLELRYSTTEANKRIAVALAAMWKPLGVKTQLINAEGRVHYADLAAGKFDVGRASWVADFDDASNFLGILTSDAVKNYGGYHSEAFDTLMEKAATTQDLDARQDVLQQAEQQMLDDYAVLPVYIDTSRNLVKPDIEGFADNALNRHLSRWMHFKNTQ
ncbi:peptide ABC transporter substrate-binding protein [Larsenimonas rhizosphaerae]|uniref:peptide ABC transporter substrate-binding protein n=1 Tax=Larsenimonas rhizosphaerae TaxID=2944682 RepID=UPI00203379B8|nr:peptide ABC transporter substrate-binding protein [Larsenimonas rhizosphaerae]MCM2131659.1 peptide ABC transporter substrate-binding protein [Larsenimonas rhizosphaerae]